MTNQEFDNLPPEIKAAAFNMKTAIKRCRSSLLDAGGVLLAVLGCVIGMNANTPWFPAWLYTIAMIAGVIMLAHSAIEAVLHARRYRESYGLLRAFGLSHLDVRPITQEHIFVSFIEPMQRAQIDSLKSEEQQGGAVEITAKPGPVVGWLGDVPIHENYTLSDGRVFVYAGQLPQSYSAPILSGEKLIFPPNLQYQKESQ